MQRWEEEGGGRREKSLTFRLCSHMCGVRQNLKTKVHYNVQSFDPHWKTTTYNNNNERSFWPMLLLVLLHSIYANNSSRLSQRPGSPRYCTATESVNLLDEMESWAFLFCSLKLSPLFLKVQYFFLIIVQCPQHFCTFFIIDKTIITETTKNELKHLFTPGDILQTILTWLNIY